MTAPSAGRRTIACHDLGFSCEWAARAGTEEELVARYRDHAKCAHALDPLPAELATRLEQVSRSVA